MTLLLIDGDQFVFKATAAVEKEIKWDDQNHVLACNLNESWDNLVGMLKRIFDRFDTHEHVLTFSSPPNFRTTVDPTYKNNRVKMRKPLCYAELRQMVEGSYKCLAMPGLEADDVMGILATKPGKTKRIIVSQDKDMKTIPGALWDGKDLVHITQEQADRFHLYQTLIGDTSDGYKGCPGVGPVKADAILDNPDKDNMPRTVGEMWSRVVTAYAKVFNEEAEAAALQQARLARILRWSDWDSKSKQPILWQP